MAERWLEELQRASKLQAVILYGSPYVWEQLIPLFSAELPAVFSYSQTPAAQAIALESLPNLGWATSEMEYSDQRFTT
jgi:beta-glucosidase